MTKYTVIGNGNQVFQGSNNQQNIFSNAGFVIETQVGDQVVNIQNANGLSFGDDLIETCQSYQKPLTAEVVDVSEIRLPHFGVEYSDICMTYMALEPFLSTFLTQKGFFFKLYVRVACSKGSTINIHEASCKIDKLLDYLDELNVTDSQYAQLIKTDRFHEDFERWVQSRIDPGVAEEIRWQLLQITITESI